MSHAPPSPDFESVVQRIAAGQHGVVTRSQLLSADISEFVIEHRIERGRLMRVHRGVYRVVPQLSPWGRWMAACLACGPGTVVSHGTAAALWDLLPGPPQKSVDVTVIGRRCRHPGIRAHRTSTLGPGETTRRAGVPVTTVARTVLDLAARGPTRTAERSLARALDQGLTSRTAVAALTERYPGRVGVRRVRTLLADGTPCLTRSEAEERFLALVRSARLDPPTTNTQVGGFEVDFYWRNERLAVEIDGLAFHGSAPAFERDRWRDQVLAARGVAVVRVTWRQLVEEPTAVAVRIAQALARRMG